MRRFYLGAVGLLLAAAAAGSGMGSAPAHGEEVSLWAGRTLHVTSGRCVGLERTAVCQEAEQKAQKHLSDELARLAEELCGRRLLRRQWAVEQAWLLQQPGVEAKTALTVSDKDYGLVAVRNLELRLPQAVLAEWSGRLVQHRLDRLWLLLAAAGTTASAWLLGGGVLVGLDRLTGGYHRRLLMLVTLTILGVGTAVGWAGVLWAV